MLISLEERFWSRVQNGEPSELDVSRPIANWELMKKLYPGTNGETIVVPERSFDLHRSLELVKEHRKTYEAAEKGILAALAQMMGEAAIGLLSPEGEGGYTRKLVKRKAYEVAETSYIDFRFSKKVKHEN